MIHTQFGRHTLQLAMTVHDTGGTDVVAFGKEQFNHHLAILLQSFRLGLDHHPFHHLRDTGGRQPGIAFDFNQTKATTTPVGETIQAAKGGYIDPSIFSRSQHTIIGLSADHFIVNGKGDNRHYDTSVGDINNSFGKDNISINPNALL
jgi:hypothetical protein